MTEGSQRQWLQRPAVAAGGAHCASRFSSLSLKFSQVGTKYKLLWMPKLQQHGGHGIHPTPTESANCRTQGKVPDTSSSSHSLAPPGKNDDGAIGQPQPSCSIRHRTYAHAGTSLDVGHIGYEQVREPRGVKLLEILVRLEVAICQHTEQGCRQRK